MFSRFSLPELLQRCLRCWGYEFGTSKSRVSKKKKYSVFNIDKKKIRKIGNERQHVLIFRGFKNYPHIMDKTNTFRLCFKKENAQYRCSTEQFLACSIWHCVFVEVTAQVSHPGSCALFLNESV